MCYHTNRNENEAIFGQSRSIGILGIGGYSGCVGCGVVDLCSNKDGWGNQGVEKEVTVYITPGADMLLLVIWFSLFHTGDRRPRDLFGLQLLFLEFMLVLGIILLIDTASGLAEAIGDAIRAKLGS